ncbi:MAG: cytochrome C [Gammaproteobacteria bacterium]|nr:cytochrome C [Gammaproteobacteria bacterium]
MFMRHLGVLLAGLLPAASHALSPEAEEGRALYPACHVCHNPEMDPPLGPPMWGVQRLYRMNTVDDDDFVNTMVEFVKAPLPENAKHQEAVAQMGLMPPMPLPDELLEKIAGYILEERFPPPCAHWRIAVKRAEQRGDLAHAEKDQMMLERFCQ